MQTPPPSAVLIAQLKTMASNVRQLRNNAEFNWQWRPDEGEWSLTEVICHLRDVEGEIHQARFIAVLEEDGAFLSGVSADDWAVSRRYQDQSGPDALSDYLEKREATIEMLSDLPTNMWQRHGVHAFIGRTSLRELLFLVTRHDEIHWEQIKTLLGGQAADGTSAPT